MKKIILIIILILSLTGCVSYTELNNLSIVNSLGIDYKDGYYHLNISVIEGSLDDKEIEKEIVTYKSNKKTLNDAFKDIYLTSNKKLNLSHIDLVVLSKDAINYKLKEIINNFLNNNQYRNNFSIILLKDITVDDFFNKKILSEDINNLLKTNEQETSMTKIKDFELFMKELLIDTNSYLPTISYDNEKIKLDGFTLIKNLKVYEKLSLDESILLNMLSNNTNKTSINNVNILENQTIITTKNNKININLNMIIQNKDKDFKINLEKDILNLLTKYQEKNYDILKFNELIRKNNYKYWIKDKNTLDKQIYNIKINIKLNESNTKGDIFNE